MITRFPQPAVLEWVASAVGPRARVVGGRRLTGGVTASVHRLAIDDGAGRRHQLVLRRWVGEQADSAPDRVNREASILTALAGTDLPVPRLVAADPTGAETQGQPALLMTRVPGHVHLAPGDPDDWLGQMAVVLPRIHAAPITAPPYDPWLDPATLEVPRWSRHPHAWRRAIDVARAEPPPYEPHFIHRDFQHFNLLWRRERLTGIVDWVYSSIGPREADIGHCRLNLAVLFSPEWAERFRAAYEAEAGRTIDARWDVIALLAYLPGWGSSIQVQAGRYPVDRARMHARVDDLMALAASRL